MRPQHRHADGLQAGVSWHLLALLFNYDYTLDESNVEVNEKTHSQARTANSTGAAHCAQEYANRHAKLAIRALARLGGYRSAIDLAAA